MKKNRMVILLFIITGILLFGFLGYKVYSDFFMDNNPTKKLKSLDLYGYTLSKNDTDLYKDNFKELEHILNEEPINYQNYAKSISKLFIIDLFTLNNKLTSTDIGGLEFLHKDLKENFKDNLGATLYKNVESNINGNRTQKLPIVSEITVTDLFETKYSYKDTEYDAYLITLNWKYKEDLGYQNSAKITVIRDGNFLYIVKSE